MTQPTVVVEMQNGLLTGFYSTTDIAFFLIDRDQEEEGAPLITGPFEPTLVKEDLSKAFPNEPAISRGLLNNESPNPYF